MPRDPVVYICLSLDSNLEVTYSVTHLFNYEGEICKSRVEHGTHEKEPHEELHNAMQWGADALNDFFTDLYGYTAS